MSWGSADLVPTSRPSRSEWALGSLVEGFELYNPNRFHTSRGPLAVIQERVRTAVEA